MLWQSEIVPIFKFFILNGNRYGTELSRLIFTDSISYVGGVAFGKDIGAERTPLSISSRLVSYVYSLLALIVINNYCANLMAFLLQENVGLPITGIDDPKVGAANKYFIRTRFR